MCETFVGLSMCCTAADDRVTAPTVLVRRCAKLFGERFLFACVVVVVVLLLVVSDSTTTVVGLLFAGVLGGWRFACDCPRSPHIGSKCFSFHGSNLLFSFSASVFNFS